MDCRGPALAKGLAAATLAACAFLTSEARGQTQQVVAETLFRDAKTLMEQGRYAEACPKLVESESLDPSNGTLLLLGLCREREGKLASAWVSYLAAADLARRERREDRAELASKNATRLEALVPRLRIHVDGPPPPGLTLELDGASFPNSGLDSAIPIDSGSHTVKASAKDKRPWTGTVDVPPEARVTEISVRFEEPATSPPPPPAPAPVPPEPARATPPPNAPPEAAATAGAEKWGARDWAFAGAGVLGFGLGGYFGARALSLRSEAKDACPASPCGNQDAVAKNDDARTAAMVSNIGLGVGLVSTSAVVTLAVTRNKPAARRYASLGFAAAGIVLAGIGTWQGVSAVGARHDATSACGGDPCASASGVADNERARDAAALSNAAFSVGVASLVASAVFFFSSSGAGAAASGRDVAMIRW